MAIPNKVQLITYPDSLGGHLKSLHSIMVEHFLDIFPGGVHILPPFPSSGDRGFAPQTYFEIDPKFGSWEEVRRIGNHFPVLLDLMVNHISRQSPYFCDFQKKGRRSSYADLFLTLDKVWPKGLPPVQDVSKIFLRRPEHPFADITIRETGQVETVWATFGKRDWSEQIDLDVNSPATRQLLRHILEHMSQQRVRMLRLDAVAYVTKKAGTSCFFVEPEIYEFLEWISLEAAAVGMDVLPEVHSEYIYQRKLADHGFWVYDFTLPLLVLHTLQSRSARALKDHLQDCPRRQFTQLDCHDGIPVQPDLDGLLDVDSAKRVVNACLERGANLNRILSDTHKKYPDFDAHQINCTYYSALDRNDDAYLEARAIQFFAPGIPQVYYVGLLAGENDQEAVRRTGEGREINRHNYTLDEIKSSLQKPVVQRLMSLIRFRNTYPAFDGRFEIQDSPDHQIILSWEQGANACRLTVNLEKLSSRIEYKGEDGAWQSFSP